jgi:hypothetical protein
MKNNKNIEREAKVLMQDILTQDWDIALPLVAQLRSETNDMKYYENFEHIATRWSAER